MSTWHGWDEDEVRCSAPASSSFTPINTPGADQVAPALHEQVLPENPACPTEKSAAQRAVSQYLGRGKVRSSRLMARMKGNTRVAAASGSTEAAKRREGSAQVDHGIAITNADDTTGIDVYAEQHEGQNARPPTDAPVSMTTLVASSGATESAPIYGQTTSMEQARDSTSVRTSMDSVKATEGQSCFTQYQSSSAHLPPPSNAQTWLNPAGKPPTRTQEHVEVQDATINDDSHHSRPSRKAKLVAKQKNSDLYRFKVKAVPDPGHLNPQLVPARGHDHLNGKHASLDRDRGQAQPIVISGEDELGEMDEDALVHLDKLVEQRPQTPPARNRKQNVREIEDEDDDYRGALFSVAEQELLAKFKSTDNAVQPIVRTPFPSAILDRSPILGANNSSLLRTCFRLGEALNAGCQAVRSDRNIVIELYARVGCSWRDNKKQFFVFKDMYHDKPPHLDGVFDLWDQSSLWDLDSKVFLGRAKISVPCRIVGRMRRDVQRWKLEVLSIWEVNSSDIEFAAGLYADDAKNAFQW